MQTRGYELEATPHLSNAVKGMKMDAERLLQNNYLVHLYLDGISEILRIILTLPCMPLLFHRFFH